MDAYDLTTTSYGKTGVKLLFVKRESDTEDIVEFEVSTLLQLNDTKDYIKGDNSLVIPTDTQKNLVYVIAQRYGVTSPEQFALHFTSHMMSTYNQVSSARVRVETVHGWRRIIRDGKPHNHSFISAPECTRYAEVFSRRGEAPQVSAGLKGLRVLKTTQSAFIGFNKCDNTTLQEAEDRVMSTVVEAQWVYGKIYGFDFCEIWSTVVDCILDQFAGPSETGIYSPSVQLTIYDTERQVLARIKQIEEISMALPNVHYFEVDMKRFKSSSLTNTLNVYLPTDKPSGIIQATLRRGQMSKL